MRSKRLSAEDEKAFLDALDGIWSAIGYDCLVSSAEDKGIKSKRFEDYTLAPAEQVMLPRTQVVDIVLDHFVGYGARFIDVVESRGGVPRRYYRAATMQKEQYERIRDWVLSTSDKFRKKVIYQRFSAKRYGA